MTSRGLSDRLGMAASLPAPGGLGDDLASALPRLTQETELQKMLADEKMRSEQHKNNYQTLKAEHTRLQDEYVSVQNELKTTIEESKLVQEKYKTLLESCRRELASKHGECEELKGQVYGPQKKELMKSQLKEEVEVPYRQKYQQMEAETEGYRNEYNKIKYEFSFLKSEYEHEKSEHVRVIEEMKLRHEAEVINLRKERETMIAKLQDAPSSDSQRARTLQRENAQLNLKVKGLLTELDEIRAQREHAGLQSDHVTRLQAKQLTEHSANVKALETEKDTLRRQLETLQREISAVSTHETELTTRIHELEKESIVLKNRAEEVTHKSKVELTNLKMEMLRERGELERERDKLRNQIADLESQIDIIKHTTEQQGAALVDKEREAVRRIQAAQEEEWKKLHRVENEKLELEAKLQEVERRKIDEESSRSTEREKTEERVRLAQDAKEAAEKEYLVIKTKLEHQQSLISQLERERSENSELKIRLHRIESQYSNYVSSEQELVEVNDQLKRQNERLTGELRTVTEDLTRTRDHHQRAEAQNQVSHSEEKHSLQKRVDELDDQLGQTHAQLQTTIDSQAKKKKQYSSLINRLKNKLSLAKAKIEELKIEREALKKSVPADQHYQLKKQLKDLLRRHNEYRACLLGSNLNQVNIGDMSFASVTQAPGVVDRFETTLPNYSYMESQHQKDLALLKERLDLLDDNQKQQLQQLKGISPIYTPIKHRSPLGSPPASPRLGSKGSLTSEDDAHSVASELDGEKVQA